MVKIKKIRKKFVRLTAWRYGKVFSIENAPNAHHIFIDGSLYESCYGRLGFFRLQKKLLSFVESYPKITSSFQKLTSNL
ncbi:MAG: hypothetical protein NZ108_07330 [Bacteroidia bacterium]|nr:hypothetical protein [Bacteroidia bacterium]